MTDNPRPFAAQARELCPESDEHHDRVWFCAHCWTIEMRLTPLSMMPAMTELLKDADLTVTYRRLPGVTRAAEVVRRSEHWKPVHDRWHNRRTNPHCPWCQQAAAS